MKVDNGSLFDDLMLIQDFARPTIDVQKGGRDMDGEYGWNLGRFDDGWLCGDLTMDGWKKIQKRHKQYCCCLLKSCQCPPLQKYYQTNDLLSPQFCTDFPGKSRSMCNIMAAASPNIRLSINTFNI